MDVATTAATMMQSGAKSEIGIAALKMALKSEQSAAALLSKAVESAASAPPPPGMGRQVDMTV
ncbi:hypothetical protein CXZ10_01755 [Pleomorphomonas diazotrophica]|uniref:Motility protein n=1 Tax=Pleomorphomonas diazotrophica TaxID=1166257 RepID=A0A1I4R7B1_9HYPH|nr:putative motility protein [Pleomorphomonas diazotrophica]PKR90141.1 hypothetical protein CXZ10_01755 [Pleomorphomonas diazotrophica]SFM48184.1 Putative motility protein [Pleomorphomonas diazotrophica]